MESAQHVFDFRSNRFLRRSTTRRRGCATSEGNVDGSCRRLFTWRDEGSLYPSQVLLGVEAPKGNHIVVDGQAAWDRFWNLQATDCTERHAGFKEATRLPNGGPGIGPEDFRLREDSPGYRAGKDGKDLGADVDLVGPGPAYERWKKTPEYQQWLKETGQKKSEADQESGIRSQETSEIKLTPDS